ncbi:hypothetical protein [Candidatus Tisiphia endosymbiont of Nemotelus uliginosus]|uniref:hypothetical protein n=1 Tax=Candidatus Tisiphia endosymbiont of Nemotelus uliginosus TaxID=3077926 RepID=UPI0035C8974B
MQQIVNSSSSTLAYISANSNQNDTIFYNFVGNFVPPEWRDLQGSGNKAFSKTAKQLLSLVVFRLQVCHNSRNNLQDDELQESYHFFEQSLGVCQRRIRQCMVELQEGGFIHLYNTTVVKQHIKCRNTPCIKLAKNFRPYPKKFSHESEKSFGSTRKKFQAHNIIDINNKSNISRSSESEVLQNVHEENEPVHEQEQKFSYEQSEERISNIEDLTEKAYTAETRLATSLSSRIQKMSTANSNELTSTPSLNTLESLNNNGWFTRKRLADFHPLTEEDADLLQLRSNREFNLNFINKLLLKLAEQYPNHHFYNKKVVFNYMVKVLAYELRESSKVNNSNFQFKSNDPARLKEQYLDKIERSLDTSKQAQLKRKIAGIFESNTAYELLTSCEFKGDEQGQYQLQLLKDIALSDHIKAKILEQVQAVYGNKIKQLQIIPFIQTTPPKPAAKMEDKDQNYLAEFNKLDPDSVWYKIRRSLLAEHGQYADHSTFSKLAVVEEDNIGKKVILKGSVPFIDYLVRQRYMGYLRLAFQAQNFTFELGEMDKSGEN